jgi:hypothetical protein
MREAAHRSSLYPGPSIAGAQEAFLWCAILTRLAWLSRFPLCVLGGGGGGRGGSTLPSAPAYNL